MALYCNAFINHEGVDNYRVMLHLYEGSKEVLGIDDPDQYGNTPFMYTIKFTNPGIAKRVLDMGVNINAKNKTGETAMSFAIKRENPDLVNFLLDNGVDYEARVLAKKFIEDYNREKAHEADILKKEELLRTINIEEINRKIALCKKRMDLNKWEILNKELENYNCLKQQLESEYEIRRLKEFLSK